MEKQGFFVKMNKLFRIKANLWNFLKNRSNEIRIRREPPVIAYRKTVGFFSKKMNKLFRNLSGPIFLNRYVLLKIYYLQKNICLWENMGVFLLQNELLRPISLNEMY